MTVTLYHNARCSKSRAALALLAERGITPDIVAYLETPPNASELSQLLKKLGLADARDLMRKGEAAYQTLGLDNPALDQATLIAALAAHPQLIERPIVVRDERAMIGRPPERILEVL